MPTEIFVSCVGDLATLGEPVGRDLGPATPWFVFSFFLLFCCPRCSGEWKVLLWQLPCHDPVEFLRLVTGARRGECSLSGQILGRSVSALLDFSGFF